MQGSENTGNRWDLKHNERFPSFSLGFTINNNMSIFYVLTIFKNYGIIEEE
jgi:hypothetical protein